MFCSGCKPRLTQHYCVIALLVRCFAQNTESVRNFLIEKLKAAEMEIKSLMANASSLRKQSASDQEVIAMQLLSVSTNSHFVSTLLLCDCAALLPLKSARM